MLSSNRFIRIISNVLKSWKVDFPSSVNLWNHIACQLWNGMCYSWNAFIRYISQSFHNAGSRNTQFCPLTHSHIRYVSPPFQYAVSHSHIRYVSEYTDTKRTPHWILIPPLWWIRTLYYLAPGIWPTLQYKTDTIQVWLFPYYIIYQAHLIVVGPGAATVGRGCFSLRLIPAP